MQITAKAWKQLARKYKDFYITQRYIIKMLDKLASRRLELLRRLEWSYRYKDGHKACPVCFFYKDENNHAKDCELARELEGTGGEEDLPQVPE